MTLTIKPSDLRYKYKHKTTTRELPKFSGKPDPHPFDRDDLYEVLPMLAAVMEELGSDDGRMLHQIEEVMVHKMPSFIATRAEVYDCLVTVMRDSLAP